MALARPVCCLLLLLAVLSACGSDPVRRDLERTVQHSTPAGADAPVAWFNRSQTGVDAEWAFTLTAGWESYRDWAAEQLSPEYTCAHDGGGRSLRCERLLEEDHYSLTLTPSERGDAVRAVFLGRPSMTRRARKPAGLLVVALALGCEPAREAERELQRVAAQIVPESAGLEARRPPVVKRGVAVSADWTFEAAQSWPEYIEVVTANLVPPFERLPEPANKALFVRVHRREVYTLLLEPVEQSERRTIRATFTALPL